MEFTQEHEGIRRNVKKFIDTEINPHVDAWEEAGIFPAHDVFKKLGDQGYLGINKPAKYGGMGLDYSYQMVFLETLGHIRCGGVPMAIGVQTDMATPALARFGSEELCKEFLVPSIAGDYVACLGVSEVGAGSDVASIKTTAKKDGGDYVINGGKMWTTSGTQADWMCLLANTSDGPAHKNKSLICVPMKTKGVKIARKLDKLGMRSSDTAQIFFEDVRVPQRNLHRQGRRGLHLPDAAVPGGAAVCRRRRPRRQGAHDRRHHRVHRPAQGLRPVDPRQPGGALPPGRAQDRGGDAARADLSRGRADAQGRGRDHARLHGQAEVRPPVARDLRRLPAVLGRHGLHERDPISRAYRDTRLGSIGGGADEIMLSIICKHMGILPGKRNK